MGLLARLTGRAEPRERLEPVLAQETRNAPGSPDSWAALIGDGARTASGQPVNVRVVMACVNAVATVTASLPTYVYQRAGAGRVEAPNHPVARLLRQPNDHQTGPDWMEWAIAQVLLHGNALSRIEYDGAGRPVALHPIPWPSVSPMLLPSGRLAYDVLQGSGPPRRYLADEVWHLRDRSDDGLLGRSRLSRAPDVLGNAAALQEWSGNVWRNQATPSGAVEIEGSLTEDAFKRLRVQFDQSFTGTRNARKVLILDNKATWRPMSVSPEDAEVLASRKFTVEELCRLYQVPPPIIQDYSRNTFTNAATAGLWFATFSLAPWCRKIEAEFARSLFGAGSPYSLEIDLSGLMRGDFTARWQAWKIAVDSNILDANEVREAEGYSPKAGAAGG